MASIALRPRLPGRNELNRRYVPRPERHRLLRLPVLRIHEQKYISSRFDIFLSLLSSLQWPGSYPKTRNATTQPLLICEPECGERR